MMQVLEPRNGRYPTIGKPRGPGGNGAVLFLALRDAHKYLKIANMAIRMVRTA